MTSWQHFVYGANRNGSRSPVLSQPCEVCLEPIERLDGYHRRGHEERFQHEDCFVGDRDELPHGMCRACMERPARASGKHRMCPECMSERNAEAYRRRAAMSGDEKRSARLPMSGLVRRRGKSRAAQVSVRGLLLVAALLGGTLVAFAQDGLEVLPEAPKVKTPTLTFKPERNANKLGGQEFIRFTFISGTHETDNGDGTSTTGLQTGTIYQRVSSIDSIGFDPSHETRSVETSVVWLTSGRWYVVTGGCDENWERFAEAAGVEFKPSRGEKE